MPLQKAPEYCDEIHEKMLDLILNSRMKWGKSVVKKRYSIRGWIRPIPIFLLVVTSTNLMSSRRLFQRLYVLKEKKSFDNGCITLYSSLHCCSNSRVSSMCGSMDWAWTHGAEKCPSRLEMGLMPTVCLNVELEDEQGHGRCKIVRPWGGSLGIGMHFATGRTFVNPHSPCPFTRHRLFFLLSLAA